MSPEFLLALGIFAISSFTLVQSADYFIEYIEKLGEYFRLPHFITGVLLVAIGTSLPEFSTSIASVIQGESQMLAGNVLGTVIANICLGLGLISVISNKNITFTQNVFSVHFPIFIIAIGLATATMANGEVTFGESLFFLGVCGMYLWFLLNRKNHDMPEFFHTKFHWKMVVIPVVSLLLLLLSSEFVVRSVVDIAEIFNLSKTSLSATLIAVGTSLPEMIVVFTMLKKKMFDMAIGNVLGSNIFDILLIFGIGGLIAPLEISAVTLEIILPAMIITTFIYWGISLDKNISKYEGGAMTLLYFLFVGKLLN